MEETLCRPDDMHWCVECCLRSGAGCFLLGDTGDGKKGCLGLGHAGKKYEGLTELPNCLDIDCLEDFLPEDRDTILQAILKLPSGEFKMSEVLAQFKIGQRVCA